MIIASIIVVVVGLLVLYTAFCVMEKQIAVDIPGESCHISPMCHGSFTWVHGLEGEVGVVGYTIFIYEWVEDHWNYTYTAYDTVRDSKFIKEEITFRRCQRKLRGGH
jgi:hypothetical protein